MKNFIFCEVIYPEVFRKNIAALVIAIANAGVASVYL